MHPPRTRAAARITLATAIATAVVLPATAGFAAPAADTAPPQVEEIRFSRATVAVAGLAVVPVTVSVHLTDASGVAENATGMDASPQLTLGPVPGPWSRLLPKLSRTSGTATDGVWSATVNVPSTWHGAVRVTSVRAVDRAGNELSDELTDGPALRVTGVHRPALSFHFAPLAGGGFRLHGQAYYPDTGRPIARQPLATSFDSGCDLDGGAADDIVTDAYGRYEKRFPHAEANTAGCVALAGPAAPGQRRTLIAYHIASAPQASIPDAAMPRAEDLRGAIPEAVTDDYWSALRPPQPCSGGPYPSAVLLRADRAVSAVVGVGERPTVVLAHVATYRSDGAHRYLRDLRRAIAACDRPGPLEPRWTVLATGVAGDESVLLELREYVDHAEAYKSTYVVAARAGQALVVVADTGWETGNGHRDLVQELSVRAVARARVLNG